MLFWKSAGQISRVLSGFPDSLNMASGKMKWSKFLLTRLTFVLFLKGENSVMKMCMQLMGKQQTAVI